MSNEDPNQPTPQPAQTTQPITLVPTTVPQEAANPSPPTSPPNPQGESKMDPNNPNPSTPPGNPGVTTPNQPNPPTTSTDPSSTSKGFSKSNKVDRMAAMVSFAMEVREVCDQHRGAQAQTGASAAIMDPGLALNFLAPLENILEQQGLDFLKNNVVPILQQKLDDVKSKYGFDLTLARALLDGLQNAK